MKANAFKVTEHTHNKHLSQKFKLRSRHPNCKFIRYKNDALEVRVPLLEISRFKAENKLVKVRLHIRFADVFSALHRIFEV